MKCEACDVTISKDAEHICSSCESCGVPVKHTNGVDLCSSCREFLQVDVRADAPPVVAKRTAVKPLSMPLFDGKKLEGVSGSVSWIAPGSKGVNNWRAGRIIDGDGRTIKFAGSCLVVVGDVVRLHGEWEDDPKWGRQFRVSYATAALGRNYESIRRLIENDKNFEHIGPKRAEYIASFLRRRQLNLEDVLESEALLDELRSEAKLPEKAVEHLVQSWSERREENIAKAEMISLGVPTKSLEPIWKAYGRFALGMIRENPYMLTETIDGFGIVDADKIAKVVKISDSDPRRIVCGVMSAMHGEVIGNGHTWITKRKLGAETVRILQIGRAGDHKKTSDTLDMLLSDGRLTKLELPGIDGEIVCDPELMAQERKFAETFSPEAKEQPNPYFVGESVVEESLSQSLPQSLPVRYGAYGDDDREEADDYDPYDPRKSRVMALSVWSAPKPRLIGPLSDGWVKRISGGLGSPEKPFIPSEKQIEAIKAFVSRRITALTGKAGTGKTATVKMILRLCEERRLGVALAAPTGKAAMRLAEMVEAAGLSSRPPSTTIHRLLGYQGDKWGFNAANKLPHDVLVLDECSMIDVSLMSRLIDALKPSTALVLVGDHNQLPPVGPGATFRDVIESELCHVVRLETIFRQAGALRANASEILRGVMTPTTRETAADGTEVEPWRVEDWHKEPIQVHDAIVAHYRGRLTELGARGLFDVQVLASMYNGAAGITALNKSLRVVAHETIYGETIDPESATCVGDKVIQTKNDYQVGLMNGDQCIVMSTSGCINEETGKSEPGWVVEVVRGDKREEINVPLSKTSGFMHAYAISIHRYQGSETEHVIGSMHSEHDHMLNRPLIYTTSTRASKTLTLVGDRKGLYDGAKKDNTAHRRTLTAPQWLVNKLRQDPAT